MVAQHEAVDVRSALTPTYDHIASDQTVIDTSDAEQLGSAQQNGMLHLRFVDEAAWANR